MQVTQLKRDLETALMERDTAVDMLAASSEASPGNNAGSSKHGSDLDSAFDFEPELRLIREALSCLRGACSGAQALQQEFENFLHWKQRSPLHQNVNREKHANTQKQRQQRWDQHHHRQEPSSDRREQQGLGLQNRVRSHTGNLEGGVGTLVELLDRIETKHLKAKQLGIGGGLGVGSGVGGVRRERERDDCTGEGTGESGSSSSSSSADQSSNKEKQRQEQEQEEEQECDQESDLSVGDLAQRSDALLCSLQHTMRDLAQSRYQERATHMALVGEKVATVVEVLRSSHQQVLDNNQIRHHQNNNQNNDHDERIHVSFISCTNL